VAAVAWNVAAVAWNVAAVAWNVAAVAWNVAASREVLMNSGPADDYAQPRSRSPRGVGRKPAAASAAASGES
jgi:hypothetical protein